MHIDCSERNQHNHSILDFYHLVLLVLLASGMSGLGINAFWVMAVTFETRKAMNEVISRFCIIEFYLV